MPTISVIISYLVEHEHSFTVKLCDVPRHYEVSVQTYHIEAILGIHKVLDISPIDIIDNCPLYYITLPD